LVYAYAPAAAHTYPITAANPDPHTSINSDTDS